MLPPPRVGVAVEPTLFSDALRRTLCPATCDHDHVVHLDRQELVDTAGDYDVVVVSPPVCDVLLSSALVVELPAGSGGTAGHGWFHGPPRRGGRWPDSTSS